MNILNIEKTEQEIKKEEARRQAENRKQMAVSLAWSFYTAYKDFWESPILSPQEQCDLFGTSAHEFFSKHQATVLFIEEHLPDVSSYVPLWESIRSVPSDKQVTINEDGTVTITNV
jgi:hypothetical protein